MNFLVVSRRVRGGLGGFPSGTVRAFEVFANLLAGGAGNVEVSRRVALNRRGTAPSRGDLVSNLAQPAGQLGLIDGRGKLLRGEALRLDGARLAVVALGDVENDSASTELRRDIAIDRAGCIAFECGGDKLARGFGRMIAADAGLRVVFELIEGNADALPVRFSDTLIGANKRGERDRFGRGTGRIPSGSMLHHLDAIAVSILIFIRRSLSHNLLAGLCMLALAEFREVLGRDRPGKA